MSKSIATNRNAFRNYHIGDKYECGISLLGNEVKSIKSLRVRCLLEAVNKNINSPQTPDFY